MATPKGHTIKLVRDLMHIGVITCQADMPLVDAVAILLRENLESLIVLDVKQCSLMAGRVQLRAAVSP